MKHTLQGSKSERAPIKAGNADFGARESTALLLRDFRNSYKFSQGNPTSQKILFTLLRDEYTRKGGRLQELAAALPTVGQHIGRLALPRGHKEVADQTVRSDFEEAFATFSRCLTDATYMPPITSLTKEQIRFLSVKPVIELPAERIGRLLFFIDKTVEQESRYLSVGAQYNGRPRTSGGADPYESYLRTYVLAGADTHSVAYNAIFAEARELLVATHPNPLIASSKAMWESHHPDNSDGYYPPAYIGTIASKV